MMTCSGRGSSIHQGQTYTKYYIVLPLLPLKTLYSPCTRPCTLYRDIEDPWIHHYQLKHAMYIFGTKSYETNLLYIGR